jgi:EpsD family peptidyl-prolyl cis-trans isomerase
MARANPNGGAPRARGRNLACILLAAGGIGACTPAPESAPRLDDVLARVNGEEITFAQIGEQLARDGSRDTADARRRALDRVIDRRLLEQRAIARGLDRDPATQRAMDGARRDLLAQAAIDRSTGAPEVSEREARAFYAANPDRFASRKIYAFRRFTLERGHLDAPVKQRLDVARRSRDVVSILEKEGIAYAQFTEVRTAESLPPVLLSRAVRMTPGDILMFGEEGRMVLMQLMESMAEPVGFDAAMPGIRAHLAQLKRQQKADRLVKDLRRRARIEYLVRAPEEPATALADGKPVLGEPLAKRPLQSDQTTIVR